jgi:8-oxo-dGTP pyrophosphatase MutT (NUDIX family)
MSDAKPILDAATIVIMRDRPTGPEVFMVVRHHQIDFAAGALVFPGGKVDAADGEADLRQYCAGADGLDDRTLAFQIGAIREAFEESGVLFAREQGAAALISGERLRALEPWRDRLNAGGATMRDLAATEGLEFALDCLAHYAHWITPDLMPKRFDTQFYLARAPEDHLAVHDGGENVDSIWINPAQALEDVAADRRTMVFPTRMNVQKLAQYETVDAAIAACGNVVTIEPFLLQDPDGTTYLRIQANAGYGDPKEPIGWVKG